MTAFENIVNAIAPFGYPYKPDVSRETVKSILCTTMQISEGAFGRMMSRKR